MASSSSDSGLSSPLSSLAPSSRSCSPLSELSRSPTPPTEIMRSRASSAPYPSPPASQQTSQSGSPAPDGMDSHDASDKDGPPPAKRRRISEKLDKGRTTQHLDLRGGALDLDQQRQLDRLLNVLHKRQKIVVIAGAGISVSAGIPDFRSSQGLFRSLKEEYNLKGSGKHLFDASVYKDDVSTSSFHDMVNTMSRLTKDAKPTPFHHMLATIAHENRLLRLYSQNVDGIDTGLEPLKTSVPLQKGTDGKWPRTVQVHGGLDKMVCSKCHELSDLDPTLFDGPVPPLCPNCEVINSIRTNDLGKRSHGIGRLRPRMVLYNEHNPDDEAIGAVTKDDLRKRPDAVIVVGTTLKVPGVRRIVREMCATVRDRRGGVAIWINSDPPPIAKDLEDCWDIIVQGPCDEVAKHAAMRRWDAPVAYDFSIVSDETEQAAITRSKPLASQLKHAVKDSADTLQRNEYFKPPSPNETPRRPIERPAYSPLTGHRHLVMESIEEGASTDSIAVASRSDAPTVQGLLTPSKSRRNTPVSKDVPKFPNLGNKLKDAGVKAPTNKSAKKAAPKKKANVKYVKPALSQVNKAKPAAKPGKSATKSKLKKQAPQKQSLKNTFGASKAASVAANAGKKDPDDVAATPSKLRQVTNMSSLHPVSLQDPRMNPSPISSEADPDLKSRMSISSITN